MNMEQIKQYEKIASEIARQTLRDGYNPSGLQGLQYAVGLYRGPDQPIVHAMIGASLVLVALMEAKEILGQFTTADLMKGIFG